MADTRRIGGQDASYRSSFNQSHDHSRETHDYGRGAQDYGSGSSYEGGAAYDTQDRYSAMPRPPRGRQYSANYSRNEGWSDTFGMSTATALAVGAGLVVLAGWLLSRSGQTGRGGWQSASRDSWSASQGSSAKADISALEALTSTLTDSIDGYEEAAEVSSNSGISSFLREKARERRGVTSEFRGRIAALGGNSDVGGSASAALHRRFLDLRSMFQNDTTAAIAEVERGEGYLKERFESYMQDQNLSTGTRELIRSTYERVRFDHSRWDALKQAQGSVV